MCGQISYTHVVMLYAYTICNHAGVSIYMFVLTTCEIVIA